MPYKRRDVALNDDDGPIDRSGGEEISLKATGGLYVEQMDVGPIEISFNDSVERFPIYSGRQFGQKFEKFKVYHGAIGSGTLRFITFEKGEDIFDGTPLSANPFDSTVAQWDDDLSWPGSHQQIALGQNALSGLNAAPYKNTSLNDLFIQNVTGAGTATLQLYDENLGVLYVADKQVRIAINLPMNLPLTVLQTVPVSDTRKVYIDTYYIALPVVPATDYETGIQYAPTASGIMNWIPGNPGYGIYWVNSLSGWAFVANVGAFPPEETTLLDWPVAFDKLAKVEIVHIAANATARAKLLIYVNAVLLATRTWEPGSVLPDYSDRTNSGQITRNIRAITGASFFVGGMRFRSGSFDSQGIAV